MNPTLTGNRWFVVSVLALLCASITSVAMAQTEQGGTAENSAAIISVAVLGQVQKPGVIRYTSGMTAKDAIEQAGGFTDRADAGRVTVCRLSDGTQGTLDGRKALEGDAIQNAPLRPGDTLYVPERPCITVVGAVTAPGVLPYQERMTLQEAIRRAGGFTKDADKGKVVVLCGNPNDCGKVEKGAAQDLTLQPDAIVIVPQRGRKNFLAQIFTPLTGWLPKITGLHRGDGVLSLVDLWHIINRVDKSHKHGKRHKRR